MNNNKALDVLFLSRTVKKHRYFSLLVDKALVDFNCKVISYHFLPKASSASIVAISPTDLEEIIDKFLEELFNARSGFLVEQLLKPLVSALSRRQVPRIYNRLFSFLEQHQPACISIWNGHKYRDNILKAVNKHFSIPVLYLENGLLPDSTTYDDQGINALNSIPKDPDFFKDGKFGEYKSRTIVGREYTRKVTALQNSLPEKYLLVPFQKERDSQILENSPHIKSMTQLFNLVKEALDASSLGDVHVIFREHPSSKTPYNGLRETASKHPKLHFDESTPLNDAIANATAVITINSSVGLEALLLNKKVIVLGDAYYSLKGLVLTAHDFASLTSAIKELHNFTIDKVLRDNFLAYLANFYTVEGNWGKADETHFKAVNARYHEFFTAHSQQSTSNRARP